MNKAAIFLFFPMLLSGCAEQPPKPLTYEQQQIAARMTDVDHLCKNVITKPIYKQSSEEELGRRNATCDWPKIQMMIQNEQYEEQMDLQRRQAMAAAYLQMRQPAYQQQPYQMPINQPINCTTTYIGNQAQTQCR